MTLHLFVDSTYHFRDTLSVCEFKNKDTLYIWADGHETEFKLPSHDTAYHLIDTLPTLLYRFDSIYDLYVDYHQKYFTQISAKAPSIASTRTITITPRPRVCLP